MLHHDKVEAFAAELVEVFQIARPQWSRVSANTGDICFHGLLALTGNPGDIIVIEARLHSWGSYVLIAGFHHEGQSQRIGSKDRCDTLVEAADLLLDRLADFSDRSRRLTNRLDNVILSLAATRAMPMEDPTAARVRTEPQTNRWDI